jgi:uracil phosphoribosyltransferase
MSRDLSKEFSLINHFVAELRDVNVQNDRLRFRRNLERIGEVLALEISKNMDYQEREITTPLGIARPNLLKQQPVIVSILRAGLPMHQGLLNYFDMAGNSFVSAYRKGHAKGGPIEVEIEYLASPSLEGETVILCDPMLATGTSLVLAYEALLEKGTPKKVIVACAIASMQGVRTVEKHLPEGTDIICGAIDDELNDMSYIIPGLGDAGDLAYGPKS